MTRDDAGQQRDGLLSRLRRRMGRDTAPRRAAAPQPGMFTARSVAIPPPPEPPEDRLFEPGGGRADDTAEAPEAAEAPEPPESAEALEPPESAETPESAEPTLADLAEELHRHVIEDAADAAVTEEQLPTARLEPEPFLFPPAPEDRSSSDTTVDEPTEPVQETAVDDDAWGAADQAWLDAAEDAEDAPEDTVAGARPMVEPSTHGPSHILVHDERLDRRPGPIRMSPSEAVALAQDGPAALRRRTRRQDD